MAEVFGDLTDFGWTRMDDQQVVIVFTPKQEKGSVSVRSGADGRLLPSKPIEVPVVGTAWTVNLVPTQGLSPETWYEVSIGYVGATPDGEGFWQWDFYGLKVFVPPEGGRFGDLPGVPLSPDYVLVGLNPPPLSWNGWWLHSAPGDPNANDPDDLLATGSGRLSRRRRANE